MVGKGCSPPQLEKRVVPSVTEKKNKHARPGNAKGPSVSHLSLATSNRVEKHRGLMLGKKGGLPPSWGKGLSQTEEGGGEKKRRRR